MCSSRNRLITTIYDCRSRGWNTEWRRMRKPHMLPEGTIDESDLPSSLLICCCPSYNRKEATFAIHYSSIFIASSVCRSKRTWRLWWKSTASVASKCLWRTTIYLCSEIRSWSRLSRHARRSALLQWCMRRTATLSRRYIHMYKMMITYANAHTTWDQFASRYFWLLILVNNPLEITRFRMFQYRHISESIKYENSIFIYNNFWAFNIFRIYTTVDEQSNIKRKLS